MNPNVKKLWVDALRSGSYKQGRYRLRRENNFCCLGVLCNVHAQEHPEIAAKEKDPNSYLGNQDRLPLEVVRWAGLLNDSNVAIQYQNRKRAIANLNDQVLLNFNELADLIEQQK